MPVPSCVANSFITDKQGCIRPNALKNKKEAPALPEKPGWEPQRLIHLNHVIDILLPEPHLVIQKRFNIKGVLLVEVCGQFEKRMLCQVVFVRKKRPDAA